MYLVTAIREDQPATSIVHLTIDEARKCAETIAREQWDNVTIWSRHSTCDAVTSIKWQSHNSIKWQSHNGNGTSASASPPDA